MRQMHFHHHMHYAGKHGRPAQRRMSGADFLELMDRVCLDQSSGMLNVKVVPSSRVEWTSSLPPWATAI